MAQSWCRYSQLRCEWRDATCKNCEPSNNLSENTEGMFTTSCFPSNSSLADARRLSVFQVPAGFNLSPARIPAGQLPTYFWSTIDVWALMPFIAGAYVVWNSPCADVLLWVAVPLVVITVLSNNTLPATTAFSITQCISVEYFPPSKLSLTIVQPFFTLFARASASLS